MSQNTNDTQKLPQADGFLSDLLRAAKRTVTANSKKNADVQLLKGLHHFSRILRASGRAQNGPAHLMDSRC